MSKKTDSKEILKMEKMQLHKEITALKENLASYKVERKANWKTFKTKTVDDIKKVKKSINKLSASKK
ncbi:MAG: hypothetical protein H0U95_10305 [Bacteroidetes bacterium]|nr:hypothetical protein [Bacteroidota bacterium]